MGPIEPEPCEHHWVAQHKPGHLFYWVKICSVCHEPDWDDLDHSVEVLASLRSKGVIAYKIFGELYDPKDVVIIRGNNLHELRDELRAGLKQEEKTMSLEEHARRELKLCGQYDEDPEYSESIIRAVREFASYGHSGGSASVAREQLYILLKFEALSPITDDPAEWIDQSEASGVPMWQNRRDPTFFSQDGGATWYNINDKEKTVEKNFQTTARTIVMEYFNNRKDVTDEYLMVFSDTYVVWFSKTLQNWKALVSTNVPDGIYYEVTHDGALGQTYLDVYKKLDNITIPDDLVPEDETIVAPEKVWSRAKLDPETKGEADFVPAPVPPLPPEMKRYETPNPITTGEEKLGVSALKDEAWRAGQARF